MSKPLITIVVPCYNERHVFPLLREALLELAQGLSPRYDVEFLIVDDGSDDGSWEQILAFAGEDQRVKAISLTRNFGHQAALTCGYDFAQGDAVVTMDADLQDPPEVVHDLVREWEKGYDVVYAVRVRREGESRFKCWTASVFYRMIRVLGQTGAPPDSGDFRLMSKRSVAAFRTLRERHRYIRGLVGWLGFRASIVKYQRKPRPAGMTKYTLSRMIQFAVDAIVSSSTVPLRLAYFLALFSALPFLAYLCYAVFMRLFFNVPLVPGWSSLILSVIILGAIILFSMGIMGEYVGRIYEQSKNRPLYLVRSNEEPSHGESAESGEPAPRV
ncbi:MAG: glycosyltransferase family 2 protein [Acidobacteriota bacterium]